MSIYSTAISGTKMYRNRFNKGYRHLFDAEYGLLYPAFSRFCLPGDVWKPGANLLIRYQPTMAPPLTRSWARMRYFFVPLRLVESDIQKIITGSDEGKLIETALPTCEGILDRAHTAGKSLNINKWTLWDCFGFPLGNYSTHWNDECLPAAYWIKGYIRCWFDYYRDENLYADTNFDNYVDYFLKNIAIQNPYPVCLHKDYFTSATPWQLKGIAPTFNINLSNPFNSGIVNLSAGTEYQPSSPIPANVFVGAHQNADIGTSLTSIQMRDVETQNTTDFNFQQVGLNAADLNSKFNGLAGSFNAADLREMFAQTRVFERLARCGSRYTEFLHANFGIAPADDTLQRAQYLGGFKQPIVTTEVVSTADSSNPAGTVKYPVGTLRGHGISNGGNMCKPFVCKEFGMIFGLLDIMPELQYTQGVEKEYTYKSRWDFFNPSFQNLSEQEIRNGELFIGSDGKNDDTFGFTGIYNELRTSRDIVSGDLRDNLSYWTQAINFSGRPNLNSSFIEATSHEASFVRPFVVTDTSVAKPIIVDCYNFGDVYRPMVKHSVPGLIDHN